MKKTLSIFIFLIVFIFLLVSCGGSYSSTSSILFMVEKGHSSDYKEYWIMAYDPNNHNKEEAFKIFVEEEMVWNLIEKDKEYFALYTQKGEHPWILEQIEHLVIEKE